MKKLLVLAAVVAGIFTAGAMEFKIECEKFTTKSEGVGNGGIGSSSNADLLLFRAAKGGTATAKFDIPETQRYYVWVRDYSMNGKTRRGTISINNRKVGTFGDMPANDNHKQWCWTKAPFPVKLEAGEAEIKIDGRYNCRFDVIYFTDDPNAKPQGTMPDVPEIEPLD